jgi:hypothetical protein
MCYLLQEPISDVEAAQRLGLEVIKIHALIYSAEIPDIATHDGNPVCGCSIRGV